MKRFIGICVLVSAVVLSGLTLAQAQEKVLHIYTAFDTEEAKYYIEAFEEETGID
ncbi:Fe(3+) ABC transporter substrate-binding protein, partial [candidate division KSB3 bacterium]|nr:Fe(3+) ABC transporter substrate-binding protein [candidate division KSB3 bacterium]MBD3326389.1 Fe(3+) ABC transporter substrate-binding protein [candidate division KSB3 bacterium]